MSEVDTFVVEASAKTPAVLLDASKGILLLKGRAIPENSVDFFEPINNWIDDYCSQPNVETVLQIRLEYFNTSTSKCLLDIFRKFENLKSESKISVQWYYEIGDDEMEEAGEDYQAIVKLPFEMIEVEEI